MHSSTQRMYQQSHQFKITIQLFRKNDLQFPFQSRIQRSYSRRNFHTLRSSPRRFVPLLNGLRQQDAHEALLTILNCIHDGIKQSMIADLDDSLVDDSMISSWTSGILYQLPMNSLYVNLSHILTSWKIELWEIYY